MSFDELEDYMEVLKEDYDVEDVYIDYGDSPSPEVLLAGAALEGTPKELDISQSVKAQLLSFNIAVEVEDGLMRGFKWKNYFHN